MVSLRRSAGERPGPECPVEPFSNRFDRDVRILGSPGTPWTEPLTHDMTLATHDLSCHTGAPAAARRWTADCLRRHLGDPPVVPDVIEDAVLCISELVTNAVHAGCSTLRVELAFGETAVRVGVLDDAPGEPTLRTPGGEDLHGRGLRLVEALAQRWGVDVLDRGKLVWAQLGTQR